MEKVQKKTKLGNLKRWHHLTEVKIGHIVLFSILQLFIQASHICEPIFAAKIITSLYAVNYNGAIMWLAFGFLNVFIRQLFCEMHYRNLPKIHTEAYRNIQHKLFNKIISVRDAEIKKISKEKIINIINEDLVTVSNLSSEMVKKSAIFIRVIVYLILISSASYIAGLMCVGLFIINTFILNALSKKLSSIQGDHLEVKDQIAEKFNDVMGARNVAKDFDLTTDLQNEYDEKIDEYYGSKKHYNKISSIRDNWFFAFWNLITACITGFLIFLIHKGSLSMENYLIVISYLKDCFTYASDATNVLTDISKANISVMRINTVLDFKDKEFIQFGKSESSDIYGELMFSNVKYSNDEGDESCGTIKNANFTIDKNSLNLIYGDRNSGKKAIFYLLRRRIKPTSGVITINGIDAFQYTQKGYGQIVNFSTDEPLFLHNSIMKNFLSVSNKKNQIFKVCEILRIKSEIDCLPQGFDTDILNDENGVVSKKLRYLIGFACALLSGSRFILVYGMPAGLSKKDLEDIKNVFVKFSKTRTIILFDEKKQFGGECNSIFKIEDGVLKREK